MGFQLANAFICRFIRNSVTLATSLLDNLVLLLLLTAIVAIVMAAAVVAAKVLHARKV